MGTSLSCALGLSAYIPSGGASAHKIMILKTHNPLSGIEDCS